MNRLSHMDTWTQHRDRLGRRLGINLVRAIGGALEQSLSLALLLLLFEPPLLVPQSQ